MVMGREKMPLVRFPKKHMEKAEDADSNFPTYMHGKV
jgi:hypothetical protein